MSQDEILLYLLIDMVIIIIAARTLGRLVVRVGQPAVIGEILAGILLGPTVLGRISSGAPTSLFPKAVPLDSIANLGLIFFMFLVGLELDPKLMRAQGRRAIEISLSGIVAPLALGILIGTLLTSVNNGGTFLPGTAHPPKTLTFALFIGASMCITAFPVLARILVDRQIYKTAVGTASLCAAAVDDAIAWILLAAVVGIARTGSPLAAGRTFVLAVLFVGFMFFIARRGLNQLARRYDVLGRLSVDQVALVLAGVLLAAFVTQKIGIHAIFGAFLFGAVMPKRSGMTRELTDKIEDFALIVLLPIFFAVTGLHTNLFSLNSPSLVGWLVVIVLVATVGKFAGVGIAARLTGASTRDAATMGALMNTRGLTELVILSIGLSLGVLSDRTFAMMVVMALTTTVMAAPIVNRLLPRERVLRELADVHGEPQPVAARILVALGNPLNAASLVDVAIRLTGSRRPAELVLVRLIPTPRAPEFRTGLLDEESQVAASVDSMRRLVAQADAAGVQARPISFLSSDVGADLARIAADQQCETILLGWYRPSLPRHVIQALVHRTMALATCQVVVFMDREGRGLRPETGRPVLVALSDSGSDTAAAEAGAWLAQSAGADLRLMGYLGRHSPEGIGAESEKLALLADEIRRKSGVWAVPEFIEGNALGTAIDESARAVAVVAGLDDGWMIEADFGEAVTALAQESACPALVVRGAGAFVSGEKGSWLRGLRHQRQSAVAAQR